MNDNVQIKKLMDFSGGVLSARNNPLNFPENAFQDGENCEVSHRGLRTRKGYATVAEALVQYGYIKSLYQVRFPTNQKSYIVAQTGAWDNGTGSTYGDAVCNTGSCVVSTKIYYYGGAGTNEEFMRSFETSTGAWATLAESPAALSKPIMLHVSGVIYCWSGNILYSYNISGNSWSTLTAEDSGGTADGGLADTSNGLLYFWVNSNGDLEPHLYIYNISGDSWTVSAQASGSMYGPAQLDGDGKLRFLSMTGSTLPSTQLLYTPGTDTFSTTSTVVDIDGRANGHGTPCRYDGAWYHFDSIIHAYNGTGIGYLNIHLQILQDGDAVAYWYGGLSTEPSGGGATAAADIVGDHLYIYAGVEDVGETLNLTGSIWAYDITDNEVDFFRHGTAAGTEVDALWASPDTLPDTDLDFTAIYQFASTAGPVSCAVLNDRAVFTEGTAAAPLVWGGGMATDGSDWLVPKAVLGRQDGVNSYDVTSDVCDADASTYADVGGIQKWGDLLICCDMPDVEGFYVEMGTGNAGTSISSFTNDIALDDIDKISQRDLKGEINRWVQDATVLGHFEGAAKTLAGAAVDLGGGTVKIPCTGHSFAEGDYVEIRETTNYDGTHLLPSQAAGDADNFVITLAYNAETFAAPDEARKRITLGAGNDAPDIVAGLWIEFAADTADIVAITSAGEQDEEVQLSAAHATATVTAIYALDVEDDGCQINRSTDDYADSFTETPSTSDNFGCGGFHLRIRIPASQLSFSGDQARLTIQAETGLDKGCVIRHCSIGKAGTGSSTVAVPTEVTFAGGSVGATLATGASVTSDLVTFAIDEAADDVIVCLDMGGYFWPGGGLAAAGYSGSSTPGGNTGGLSLLTGITGAQTYYVAYAYTTTETSLAKYDSYNKATVTGTWPVTNSLTAGYVPGLIKIETKAIAAIPTGFYVGHTTGTGTMDVSYADSLSSIVSDELTPGSSVIYHAVSKDGNYTFAVFLSSAWRDIVRLNVVTWEYKDAVDAWQSATINTALGALEDAFAIAENQMDATALAAIAAADWADWFEPYATTLLNAAWGMQADGNNYPWLGSYAVTYTGGEFVRVEGYLTTGWSEGDGWTDGTESGGIPLAVTGLIEYDGASAFSADYGTVCDIPGYWYRLVMGGTSSGTTISRILYKAPCQLLSNIGDGLPDIPMRALYYNGTTGAVSDYSAVVSDWVDQSEFSKADIPMTTSDYFYVGYITRFFEVEITPYIENNGETATLSAEYWDGDTWQSLTITDGTALSGATFATQGKVAWIPPSDWRMGIPLTDTWYPRGYYVRFKVSATLSATAALSELRVRGIPDALRKHKEAAVVGNRMALINRLDAPDQVDVSRPLEEYGFNGANSGSFRVGGMDAIQAVVAAWDTLLVAKTETWHAFVDEG